MTDTNTAQRLLNHLPAIYREDPFVGRYLWAFEQVFLGLEQSIDNISTLFNPQATREEFLPWLSKWMSFTLRADLTVQQQRDFLARLIPLYRRRGTLENLRELLTIFTKGIPTIVETSAEMQIGDHSTIDVDTFLGGGTAHYFYVTVRLYRDSPEDSKPELLLRQIAIARALIDLEKPAHTYYDLDVVFPTMQIRAHSTIAVDTLLGTGTEV